MTTDPGRPSLHFTSRSGWINDPYGLTWHGGRYHLFFQHVPDQVVWAPQQRWGHAVSDDLLHWTELAVAVEPGDGDDGIWSGSVVAPDDGDAALFYTSVRLTDLQLGSARVARPTDDSWNEWVKKGVVAVPPPGLDVVAFRDPFVLHDGTTWRMLMGAGLADGTALALTYTSADLESWTYDGVLAERSGAETDPVWTGSVWECPQLFRLDERWVLVVSVWEGHATHFEAYAVGDLVDGRFTADRWGRLTYGPGYYAASTFTDADGARCLIHWVRDLVDPAARWASAHSVPHAVRLDGDRLVLSPHPVVDAARTGAPATVRDGVVETDGPVDLELVLGGDGGSATLALAGTTVLAVEAGQVHIAVEDGSAWSMPLPGASLRVLVDAAVVEVFGPAGVSSFALDREPGPLSVGVSGAASATVWNLDALGET